MMDEPRLIVTETAPGVIRVTLNRPDVHNAFDDVLIAELENEFKRLDEDRAVRVVVLAANGKSFSAGADLNWMKRMATFERSENVAAVSPMVAVTSDEEADRAAASRNNYEECLACQ